MTALDERLPAVAEALSRRRRRALEVVIDEVRDAAGERGRPAAATCVFGEGSVALALGGPAGAELAARVRTAAEGLEGAGCGDLVVDLGELRGCDRRLDRALARMRMRMLVAGVRIEWHRVPAGTGAELGCGLVETFGVSQA